MPRSASFCLVFTAIATLGYWVFRYFEGSLPNDDFAYTNVAVTSFNIAAILSLFYIFAKAEGETNAQFGKIIRDNISTVLVALIISFIGSALSLVRAFVG